jgi:asparagine synthetase B (glutamine-hydrolysing)
VSDTPVAFRFAAPADRPVVVSSHVEEALGHSGGAPPRLDPARALGLLATGHFDSHRSFFSGVGLVPPHVPVLCGRDGVLETGVAEGPPPQIGTSADEAASRLAGALLDAARRALVGASRPAITLSGGLDSTAVAWAATRAWRDLGRPSEAIAAYHLLPESGPSEEDRARAAADALGLRLVLVSIPPADPWEGTEKFLSRLPFPPDGGGVAEILAFRRRMRSDGVDAVLTGDGGDEALEAHAEDERVGFRARVRAPLRALAAPLLRARGRRRALRDAPEWLRVAMRDVPLPAPSPEPRRGLSGAAASRDRLLRCARQQAIVGFHRGLDETFGSRTSFPFLDGGVIDLVVSLPVAALRGDGRGKSLIRRALAEGLPAVVLDQRKETDQPYVEPLRIDEARRYGRSWMDRFVCGGTLEAGRLLPRDGADELLRRATEGERRSSSTLHALVGVEAWAHARGLAV